MGMETRRLTDHWEGDSFESDHNTKTLGDYLSDRDIGEGINSAHGRTFLIGSQGYTLTDSDSMNFGRDEDGTLILNLSCSCGERVISGTRIGDRLEDREILRGMCYHAGAII